jgi:hypothetical protein
MISSKVPEKIKLQLICEFNEFQVIRGRRFSLHWSSIVCFLFTLTFFHLSKEQI